MLLAHKVELRPTKEQAEYLDKACGSRRHCYNQLLSYFKDNKWFKSSAYQHYINVIRKEFDWYTEVSSRVTRNAIDDLGNAFKHFFRRVKTKQSDYLTSRFDRIVIEDLNVKGMQKNHKLACSIVDAGFGYLRQQVKYKAELRNCELVIANRFFPSSKTCSNCGQIKTELRLIDYR
jgi:IS605 OrfB family transposase